jgi:hypothetical protein
LIIKKLLADSQLILLGRLDFSYFMGNATSTSQVWEGLLARQKNFKLPSQFQSMSPNKSFNSH